jgi:hypothetical protein
VGHADPEELERFREEVLSGDLAVLQIATVLGIVPSSFCPPTWSRPCTVTVHHLADPLQIEARKLFIDVFVDERTRHNHPTQLLLPEKDSTMIRDMITVVSATCQHSIVKGSDWVDARPQNCIQYVEDIVPQRDFANPSHRSLFAILQLRSFGQGAFAIPTMSRLASLSFAFRLAHMQKLSFKPPSDCFDVTSDRDKVEPLGCFFCLFTVIDQGPNTDIEFPCRCDNSVYRLVEFLVVMSSGCMSQHGQSQIIRSNE